MSLLDDLNDFFEEGDEPLIVNDLKFKQRLGIGESAYRSLRAKERLSSFMEALTAGTVASTAAGSSFVATTFFASSGFMSSVLGSFGLAAAATTPIGWVLAAGLVTGGAYFGITSLLEKPKDNGFVVTPKFINTPLDVIAAALVEMMLPVSLKVALADGVLCEAEKQTIKEHFVNEWGYSEKYIERMVLEYREQAHNVSYDKLAMSLSTYCEGSVDCHKESILNEFVRHLREVAQADGVISPEEEEQLTQLRDLLQAGPCDTVSADRVVVLREKSTKVFEHAKGYAETLYSSGRTALNDAGQYSGEVVRQARSSEAYKRTTESASESLNKALDVYEKSRKVGFAAISKYARVAKAGIKAAAREARTQPGDPESSD